MKQPLVSVVVISYNQSKFIDENLDSLKAQTYTNWELIIADDSSQDDSVYIFESWLLKNQINAKKIYHSKNTGLATVLNEAVDLCAGKYLKFIAADDYLHFQCLEKSISLMEKKDDTYGMVYTDIFVVNDKSEFLPDIANYNVIANISKEQFRQNILKKNSIPALSVLMRADVIKETGKYDSSFLIEDYYRWLLISEKYFVGYIPEKLSYYRVHSQNITRLKKNRLKNETIMLQIMFDKEGFVKSDINRNLSLLYYSKNKINRELLELYRNYPYRIKRLYLSIKYNIPPFLYRVLNRLI